MPGKLLAELSTQLLYHLILSILVFGVENSLFIGVAESMNAVIQFIGGENPNCLGAVNTFPISTILILAFPYLLVYEGQTVQISRFTNHFGKVIITCCGSPC